MSLQAQENLSFVSGPRDQPLWSKTLGSVIAEQSQKYSDRIAVSFPQQRVRMTYQQLEISSRFVANALIKLALQPGDCVGILSGNCYQYIEVFLGSGRIGCPVVVFNNTYSPQELLRAVNLPKCKVLFISASIGRKSLAEHIRSIRDSNTSVRQIVMFSGFFESSAKVNVISYDSFKSHGPAKLPMADFAAIQQRESSVQPNDVLNLQFTSGTTGSPKAAMLTHINLINNGRFVGDKMLLTPQDVVCCPPPLFHCFGLVMGFLGAFSHGSSIVFPSDQFDAHCVLDAIATEKCTALLGVPTMFLAEMEANKEKKLKITTVRTGLAAGSLVPLAVMQSLQEEMNIQNMLIAYGMTETSPVTFLTSLDDPLERRLKTVGRVMPHTDAKIIDRNGNVVPKGIRGEICVSGYMLQKGYWNNKTMTDEVMKPDEKQVVWMHTGDEGILDNEGYCTITGRIKDIIIRGGENIFPAEIEERLLRHPTINEACVVGMPDNRYGEVVSCFVRLRSSAERVTASEVSDWVKRAMGSHKAPKYVWWVGRDGVCQDFPKTGSGKYQKHILKEIGQALIKSGPVTVWIPVTLPPNAYMYGPWRAVPTKTVASAFAELRLISSAVGPRPVFYKVLNARLTGRIGHVTTLSWSRLTEMSSIENVAGVRIVEVGPRDGLQNVKTNIPTSTKLELIKRLRQTGLRSIEITSVVSPRSIPQLSDCRTVLSHSDIQGMLHDGRLRAPVLVPNSKGLDIALQHNVKEVAVFVSATEGFSRANINCSVQEGLNRAKAVAERARQMGLAVRGYVSCIFACPYDGPTPLSAVLDCVRQLFAMGCYEVSLGDTLGVGVPSQTVELVEFLANAGIPLERLAGHFHDTYGQAVANIWTAYGSGIRVFDSSVGGLGGCPYAPRAKGNVATEDVVYMFERAGVKTGVDLTSLAATGTWISDQLRKTNDSRAGSALMAKSSKVQPSASENGSTTKSQKTLNWLPQTAPEGLEILRSGANIKIILNRPRNGNALTTTMISGLTDFMENVAKDPSITRVAITANGKFFCTGMDLGKDSSPVAQDQATVDAQFKRLTRLFDALSNSPQVTIACMQGPAFGGGVGLAFACDIRVMSHRAGITLSEVKLGLCPATISKVVIRELGVAFSREAMLSGRTITPEELARIGAVAVVVSDSTSPSDVLDGYLIKLKQSAPNASKMVKDLIKLAWQDGSGGPKQDEGIRKLFVDMMTSENPEAAFGLREFQRGNKRVDWDAYVLKKQSTSAKL